MSGFFTVGGWSLMSRILGFIRDAMILAYLGTGPLYQAYVVAFRLPNMFRRFFAEGAFNMAFVPMFSKRVEGGDDPDGFASDAFAGLASVLIALTLVAMAAMPWLIYGIASGFAGQEEFTLSVEFGRVAFPYVLFISLAALLSGMLNASGRFAAAAAAPVLLNIFLIAAMFAAAVLGGDIARALIWAIPLAGVAQFVLLWVAVRRAGFNISIRRPRLTPQMRKLVRVAVAAALAGGGGVGCVGCVVFARFGAVHCGCCRCNASGDHLVAARERERERPRLNHLQASVLLLPCCVLDMGHNGCS